ncbi:hypothetical protein ABVT39_020132 [Epinephelus coioides]
MSIHKHRTPRDCMDESANATGKLPTQPGQVICYTVEQNNKHSHTGIRTKRKAQTGDHFENKGQEKRTFSILEQGSKSPTAPQSFTGAAALELRWDQRPGRRSVAAATKPYYFPNGVALYRDQRSFEDKASVYKSMCDVPPCR